MTKTSPSTPALTRLIWPLRLTRAAMTVERATRAFWPVWTIAMLALALFAFGFAAAAPPLAVVITLGITGLALAAMIARGITRFAMPSCAEALARLDATLPGRPISALLDQPAIGSDDPGAQAVWAAHLRQMAARTQDAQAPAPDLRLSRQDPFALRYIAATAFVMALTFGTLGRVTDLGETVGIGPRHSRRLRPLMGGMDRAAALYRPAIALSQRDFGRALRGAARRAHDLSHLW